MRCGAAVSLIAQTGQSEAIHWPEAWAQNRTKPYDPRTLIDRSGLHRRDLMPAQGLAHDIEPARQWRITKAALRLSRLIGSDGSNEGLFRVDELRLGFGEGRSDRTDAFTRPLHGGIPLRGDQNKPPL